MPDNEGLAVFSGAAELGNQLKNYLKSYIFQKNDSVSRYQLL